MWAHSSIVHNLNMITYKIIIPPEDCEKAAKNNKILANEDGYTHELIIKMNESILKPRNEGTSLEGDSSTACKNRGQGSDPNGLDLKIRIYKKQQEFCSRPGALYKTNFESWFI